MTADDGCIHVLPELSGKAKSSEGTAFEKADDYTITMTREAYADAMTVVAASIQFLQSIRNPSLILQEQRV